MIALAFFITCLDMNNEIYILRTKKARKNNMEKTIQVKKRDTLKVYINDEDGEPKVDEKGKKVYLEFDLEDIEYMLRLNKSQFLAKKAEQDLKFDLMIIDKRQDIKGKFLLSKNEEDRIKATNKYYKTMEEAIDLFIGKGGTQKIFGDVRYYTMYQDFSEIIDPILPELKINAENISKKIKDKYKIEEKDVLKND